VAREIASAFGGSLRLPGTAPEIQGAALISVELPRSGTRSRYGLLAPGPRRA